MAKAGELDWSELLNKSKDDYKHRPTALWAAHMSGSKEGIDPLNKVEKCIKCGEIPRRPTDEEIRKAIMHNAPKQPTDEEMFGRFVVTEDMAKRAEQDWNNKFNDFYDAAKQPVNKSSDTASEWNGREPYTKDMTEEELIKWRMYIGE